MESEKKSNISIHKNILLEEKVAIKYTSMHIAKQQPQNKDLAISDIANMRSTLVVRLRNAH